MMEAQVYGFCYTILYVVLCKMFVETFEMKRKSRNRKYEIFINACFICTIFLVSVLFASDFFLKEFLVLGLSIFFICNTCFALSRRSVSDRLYQRHDNIPFLGNY